MNEFTKPELESLEDTLENIESEILMSIAKFYKGGK